jgi:hypothetical protein
MSWGMHQNQYPRWKGCRPAATLLALALLASGCSGGINLGSLGGGPSTASAPPPASPGAPPPSNPSFKDKISNFFDSSSANSPQPVAGTQQQIDCPLISIRQGASTLVIGPNGASADNPDNNGAMAVKYQATFVRAARECAAVAGQMVIKVGVEGRIVVGPAGGPGQLEVPLRIAVVEDSAAGGTKLILTKLIRIPVTVASATDNPTFADVEEGLSFPMPRNVDSYVVYIGFDPLALQDHPAAKPKPQPKPKKPAATG